MLDRAVTPFTTFGALLRRELLVTMRGSAGIFALVLVCACSMFLWVIIAFVLYLVTIWSFERRHMREQ